jgi:hypothetical protein
MWAVVHSVLCPTTAMLGGMCVTGSRHVTGSRQFTLRGMFPPSSRWRSTSLTTFSVKYDPPRGSCMVGQREHVCQLYVALRL